MIKLQNKYKKLLDMLIECVLETKYNNITCGRKLKYSLTDIATGVLYVCLTGIPWCKLYYNDIDESTIRKHYYDWVRKKIFYNLWVKMVNLYQNKCKYKRNLKTQSIDTTYVKSLNGTDIIGKNPTDRGRNATKISIICDSNGVPISYLLAAANLSDKVLFSDTIQRRIVSKKRGEKLLADKGYSDSICKEEATEYGIKLVCQNKSNAVNILFKPDPDIKKRHIIENMFGWIKAKRRVRLRSDAKISNFESFLLLSMSILTWTKSDNL